MAMRLEDYNQAAGMGVTDPMQQGGNLRWMMRVVGQHAESTALKQDILPATDTAPAR